MGLALPQVSHIHMQLARVVAITDRGVQIHREARTINAHYWLDTWYSLRVLHFSAFHINSIGLCRLGV